MISKTKQDWTSAMVPFWETHLIPALAGRPGLAILEIGCFEGRSACWFIENLCTAPGCTYTGIDTFDGSPEHQHLDLTDMERICNANIQAAAEINGNVSGYRIIRGLSQTILPGLSPNGYDLVYVDGGHDYNTSYRDIVQAERLTRPGGIIIIDDVDWRDVGRAVADLFPELWRGLAVSDNPAGGRQLFIKVQNAPTE